MWLKDAGPVSKRATVSNSDNSSQLLITSTERMDTGIYTILVKNIVGQETFSFEIRVTGIMLSYCSALIASTQIAISQS